MDLNLKNYSTFKIGGTAYRVLNLRNENDIISAISYAQKCEKRLLIIGEGSNSIFSDEDEKFIIGHMQIKGINIKEDTDTYQILRIGAGESWDEIVSWSVEHNLSGIETLSGIPGTVGASPIQNIGAYGSELSDVLISVSVYDIEGKRFRALQSAVCELSYRDSIFKKNPSKYIISEITIKLSKAKPSLPEYASIKDKFKNLEPTSSEIRNIVLETRKEKLPDYKTIPNCGSFFKNPIVTQNEFSKIKELHPNIPSFETEDTNIKLYAGWLIENIDYKSFQSTNIECYEKQKLVLINKGAATFNELKSVVSKLIFEVEKKYGVVLEVEPNLFQ